MDIATEGVEYCVPTYGLDSTTIGAAIGATGNDTTRRDDTLGDWPLWLKASPPAQGFTPEPDEASAKRCLKSALCSAASRFISGCGVPFGGGFFEKSQCM